MPKIGDEVGLVGHLLVNRPEARGQGVVGRRLEGRIGVVTAVRVEEGRHKQMFSFETTIPVPPGMSGAPVLVNPKSGGAPRMCGVASFDFSEEESFLSLLTPGHSTVAMLWPAMGLAVPDRDVNGVGRINYLSDLCARRILDNRSIGVAVAARTAGDQTEILYEDRRETPTTRIKASTIGYPETFATEC